MTMEIKNKFRQLALRNDPKEFDNIPYRFAMGYIWHYDALKDTVVKELWENAYENSRVTVVKRDKEQLILRVCFISSKVSSKSSSTSSQSSSQAKQTCSPLGPI